MSKSGSRATDWSHKFNDSLRQQTYMLFGEFADGCPDHDMGATLKYTF